MRGSRKASEGPVEPKARKAQLISSVTSADAPLGPQTLLLLHLRKGKTRSDRDHVQHWMLGIDGHAQSVRLLPSANSLVGRIEVRALFRQLLTALLLPLELFFRKLFGVRLELARQRRWRHERHFRSREGCANRVEATAIMRVSAL